MNPDTDGDGIPDGDEVYGTVAGLDLPAIGASPVVKDIFVEADWTDDSFDGGAHSHRPTAAAVAALEAAFAAAPVANPYGGPTGIALHIDYGQGGAFAGGNLIPGSPEYIVFDSEFNALKVAHFDNNRKGYFHYAIFSHRYNNASNNSSGIAEINGDDFMVTLQVSLGDSEVSKTTMHELGHNLNLRHGGFENLNRKPNYNSIMNYRFQFPGIDADCDAVGDGVLDYSVGSRLGLDEGHLDETQGVCGSPGIDWDGGGLLPDLARNINCILGVTTTCGASDPGCWDSTCGLLVDFDDWSNIVLNNLAGGDRAAPQIVSCQDVPETP